jgi:hypothetical protein
MCNGWGLSLKASEAISQGGKLHRLDKGRAELIKNFFIYSTIFLHFGLFPLVKENAGEVNANSYQPVKLKRCFP